MKYVKKFNTLNDFNSFVFNHTNTPNVSLITEAAQSNNLSFKTAVPTPHDYSKDYFTIEAIDDLSIYMRYVNDDKTGNVLYSIDNGSTWATMNSSVSLLAGNKILFKHGMAKGEGSMALFGFYNNEEDLSGVPGRFNIEGNIMSLIYGDNFNGQLEFPSENMEENWYYAFFSLFYCQDKLISAENLILPATILPERCYSSMFYGCTSLTTAPELPALTLSSGCYESMFSGCTSLNSIKCLATNIAAESCTSYWLENVAANGTFIKNEKMTSWPTGVHGIPSGWTIKNI